MSDRSVLITGSSTGIGRACALDLAARGFKVFAAVRREEDAVRLAGEGKGMIEPVIMDVTRPDEIEAARQRVGGSLRGLINNAGISINGPTEFLPLDQYRRQFEVNFFGQIAVTQAFMPAIRQARGRVVFVGSAAGWVCVPFQGPYSGSKFALEALCDALRQELKPWGIHVSLVKPGAVATPIWETSRGQTITAMAQAGHEAATYYQETLERM
jgi:NAD(P)-dependent dehydrogenase (short-subunit alcohol dehydrogenase family)